MSDAVTRQIRGFGMLAIVWGLCATFLSPASAQSTNTKTTVVIIDSGSADLLLESMVRTTIESELRAKGFKIVEGVSVGGGIPVKLLACSEDASCAQRVLSAIPARFVIFLSLQSGESEIKNFKVVARKFEVATGRSQSWVMRHCTTCNQETDFIPFLEKVLGELLAPPPLKAPRVPMREHSPSQSYQPTRPASEKQGPRGEEPQGNSTPLLPYFTLAGGISALVVGTGLVVVDGPVIENGQRQPNEFNTQIGGYALLGVGGALIGLSAWLWTQETESQALAVLPQSSGASLLWLGKF